MLAGDWNATIQDADRRSGMTYACDQSHRKFLAATGLQITDPAPSAHTPRAYTYLKGSASQECSRIDDIYLNLPAPNMTQALPHTSTRIIDNVGTNFDHQGLYFEVPFTVINVIPPPDISCCPNPKTRLKRLTQAEQALLRQTLEEQHTSQWEALRQKTQDIVQEHVRPHWDALQRTAANTPQRLTHIGTNTARQVVDDLGKLILNQLAAART